MECGFTVRGIAAGCSWATTWVQVYSLEPLHVWQNHNPRVELGVFIDDLLGGSTDASENVVVSNLTTGAAELRLAIEMDLGCKVAESKSVLVATTDTLLEKLKIAFGRFAGQASKSAANLGVDFYEEGGGRGGQVRRPYASGRRVSSSGSGACAPSRRAGTT